MNKTVLFLMSVMLLASFTLHAAINADTYITVNSVPHTLSVSIPSDYDSTKSYPLVVALHYCGSNSNDYRNGLKPICDSLDVILVCPDNNSNQIGTSDFITASIDTAKSIYKIKADEVYLTGMSCNGYALMQMALSGIYPFKGIFPWDPWVTSFLKSTFNLNSDLHTVISIGTADPNYSVVLNLYDSLKAHKANVDLVLVPGIAHTMAFAQFSNEMIRCMNYLNDTNSITIDPVNDFEMFNNDPVREIKVKIGNLTGKELNIRSLSSNTGVFANPVIDASSGNDTIIIKIIPVAGKAGTVHVVVEASEKGGSAIEQIVFKVKVKSVPVALPQTNINTDFEVYPNPAEKYIYVKTQEKNITVRIIDISGKTVYTRDSFESSAIDLSNLSKGIYFVKATGVNKNEAVRLIIR
jgi:hypothetical protein